MSDIKLPKTLAQCADLLYQTRAKRLLIQKDVEDLEELEKTLKARLIDELPKSDSTGVSGKVANVKIVTKVEPQVEDWAEFYAYVKKNNAFDLMQRRLNAAAVKERWEAKKKVPGVTTFTAVTVSVTKV